MQSVTVKVSAHPSQAVEVPIIAAVNGPAIGAALIWPLWLISVLLKQFGETFLNLELLHDGGVVYAALDRLSAGF